MHTTQSSSHQEKGYWTGARRSKPTCSFGDNPVWRGRRQRRRHRSSCPTRGRSGPLWRWSRSAVRRWSGWDWRSRWRSCRSGWWPRRIRCKRRPEKLLRGNNYTLTKGKSQVIALSLQRWRDTSTCLKSTTLSWKDNNWEVRMWQKREKAWRKWPKDDKNLCVDGNW